MSVVLLYPVFAPAQDRGPNRIDVSKYPEHIKRSYKLFVKRCSKCHSLAKPINSSLCLPEEWEGYIKKILRNPDSGIYLPDAKNIYEFLVYDSSIRKKECIEQKIKKKEMQELLQI